MEPSRPTIAIIGGGFSGACLALHLSRAGFAGRLLIFEPRAVIGQGLAYSTQDDAHRLNTRASRMSLFTDDPAHYTRWIAETGACDGDGEAALPDGRLFTRRSVYGAYVTAHIAPLLRENRLLHVRAAVKNLTRGNGAWSISTADGQTFDADLAVLATGHAPPIIPAPLSGIASHPAFIASPLAPAALAAITPDAKILIIGTGLTMADAVASLTRAGHTGPITAISRRGQIPRPHALEDFFTTIGFSPPSTAVALTRAVRAAVRTAIAKGLTWQAVFDALRARAEDFWRPLPVAERRRLLRHVRPFWDTHRHRQPPPTANLLARRQQAGTLRIEAATITSAQAASNQLEVSLRPRGATSAQQKIYDAVILTAGPGRPGQPADLLTANLLKSGDLTPDSTGQGFHCTETGLAPSPKNPPLFIIGPPTRGTFAEIISVPEIARQISATTTHVMKALERLDTRSKPAAFV